MGTKNDVIVGAKFGKWTVLEREVKNPNSRAQRVRKGALCQCECGTLRYKEYRDLYDGRSTNCGCNGQVNARQVLVQKGSIESGSVFGKLTVIEDLGMINGTHYCKCLCECGQETIVQNYRLKSGHTQSCGCLRSKGELEIAMLLSKNKYSYAREYSFPDLNSSKNYPLRFDFAIFDNEKLVRLIEFDGSQHYQDNIDFFRTKVENQKERDKLKNEYALSHNIDLVRIPYWQQNNITLELLLGDKYLVKE